MDEWVSKWICTPPGSQFLLCVCGVKAAFVILQRYHLAFPLCLMFASVAGKWLTGNPADLRKPGVVDHRALEGRETLELRVWSQPGLHSKTHLSGTRYPAGLMAGAE